MPRTGRLPRASCPTLRGLAGTGPALLVLHAYRRGSDLGRASLRGARGDVIFSARVSDELDDASSAGDGHGDAFDPLDDGKEIC